jgi:hypothetical protein
MNWSRIEDDWRQPTRRFVEGQWSLAAVENEQVAARQDMLLDKIQQSYGLAQDKAKQRLLNLD